ncbi:MAG: YraN family protein [Bacteroidales bacterium]|nr:YraN family protein [Candidatus Physcousia equi]
MAAHNETGKMGEEKATQYLIENGYTILHRNWRNRGGKEIDIVALKDRVVVFVEVKTRKANSITTPFEAVDFRKQHHLTLAAHSYIRRYNIQLDTRFDVIGITGDHLEHMVDAFPPAFLR